MRFTATSKGLIGVDITSATVKLIELKAVGGRFHVQSYAVRPLREGAVVERRIRDMEAVVGALGRVVELAQPSTRRAVVAVPASAAITRVLSVPVDLDDDEIETRIELESDKHIPFPFSDVVFDFHHLGRDRVSAGHKEILLVACRYQDVMQLTEALESAGLKAQAVDVEGFAVQRAFARLCREGRGAGEGESLALVDIGAHLCAFHVIRDGLIVYSRDALIGGRQLTEAIRDRYGVSLEEAGLAKKRGGLPPDYAASVLTPFLEMLVEQVGGAFQLYASANRQYAVNHLVLAGGSCVLPGLAERLAQRCGVPVSLANPLEDMMVSPRVNAGALGRDAPAMLTACGLAMRGRR
ncbi:type IV pilus assembly protein PilM [Halomonas sp. V046]|uniref:type IV pilus assembly protein PilM n=1 Tax=Halomonas sp. V046 TaxID=3459611 RepID=UPI004044A4AA